MERTGGAAAERVARAERRARVKAAERRWVIRKGFRPFARSGTRKRRGRVQNGMSIIKRGITRGKRYRGGGIGCGEDRSDANPWAGVRRATEGLRRVGKRPVVGEPGGLGKM